jgi:Tol biopolymer transport system component/predicted Ser/Thr protein kinase
MSDDLIGQTLGQYEIQALLGKGGMSTVYRAYQRSMDRIVAIKILPREFLHDDTFLIRFQDEAAQHAKLEHLHILPVYDVGEDGGIPYIVMRYLTGGTLSQLIQTGLPDMPTTVRLVEQTASALDHAHERGVIHRDLKPSNILLDKDRNAYLADFGIARVAQRQSDLTGSRIIGTPPYVAPEIVRKGEPVTFSVDIYALGVITYELLTGEPPYLDDDPMAVLVAHVLDPVPSARDVDPDIPPEVDRVLQRCLAKTPHERHSTAGAFAAALAEVVRTGQKDHPAPRKPEPVPAPAPVPTPPPAPTLAPTGDTPPSGTHPPVLAEVAPRAEEGEATGGERARRGGLGAWAMVLSVIVAMVGGVMLAAYVLTDGDPASLLALLTPIPTRSLRPTATATPADVASPTPLDVPTSTEAPVVLPPPGGGDRLAFASNRDGDFEIYLIDIDGGNLRQLTDNDGQDFDPVWSPDGRQIAYTARPGPDQDTEIMVMNADGSDARPVTDNDEDDADPDWSPDGEWIAFTSNRDGDFDIYVMRVDGSDVEQLTFNSELTDLTPRWSPDGTRIGYHARVGNNRDTSEIYIVDATGGAPYQLTGNEVRDEWIDWSPDGRMVAYSSGEGLVGNQRAVFGFDLVSNLVVQLTVDPVHDDDPVWSPDGGRIAFDSDRDGDQWFDLYVLDIAGGTLQQLTFDPADDVTPAWQPNP